MAITEPKTLTLNYDSLTGMPVFLYIGTRLTGIRYQWYQNGKAESIRYIHKGLPYNHNGPSVIKWNYDGIVEEFLYAQ